ncbi:MAG: twin-arginine translocase subunit TatC, partial [Planctomyces sp.]
MPRNHDLFDDTTMTFGEHLEVLRIHVFRAVVGLLLAVAVSLFFGDRIFYWLRQPVEKALRERGIDNVAMDVPKQSFYQYLTGMFSGPTKA